MVVKLAKNIALGKAVAARAGKNKAFGREIDKLKHNSPARNKLARSKNKKAK
jgi:hypothetical protein